MFPLVHASTMKAAARPATRRTELSSGHGLPPASHSPETGRCAAAPAASDECWALRSSGAKEGAYDLLTAVDAFDAEGSAVSVAGAQVMLHNATNESDASASFDTGITFETLGIGRDSQPSERFVFLLISFVVLASATRFVRKFLCTKFTSISSQNVFIEKRKNIMNAMKIAASGKSPRWSNAKRKSRS